MSRQTARMFRRVSRALRILLFGIGIGLFAWLPVSCVYVTSIRYRWTEQSAGIVLENAGVLIWSVYGLTSPGERHLSVEFRRSNSTRPYVLPKWAARAELLKPPRWPWTGFAFPIWLLATLCLAWPVTSFVVQRRGKTRGFPVEASGGEREV